MVRRSVPLAVLSALLATVGATTVAAPARADQVGGSSGGGSFGLQAVSVQVSGGPGDPVSAGSITVSVPPKCWWTPMDVRGSITSVPGIDPSSPDALAEYFQWNFDNTNGTFAPARYTLPSQAYVRAHSGPEWNWYQLQSASGVNCADEGFTTSQQQGPDGWFPGSRAIPVSYAAFQGAPPPPVVDVEDVVREVWDQASAEIDGPDLGRNPVIDELGGATLVNFPTWFWVQNVQAALAGDGRIHLEVSIPGTPVRATLDSSTDGVQVTSPVGSTQCDIDQATTEWSPGASDAAACDLVFDRANRAGWQVTGRTTWTGTWEGQDGDGATGGTLETLTPEASIDVPVGQSQSVVTGTG